MPTIPNTAASNSRAAPDDIKLMYLSSSTINRTKIKVENKRKDKMSRPSNGILPVVLKDL